MIEELREEEGMSDNTIERLNKENEKLRAALKDAKLIISKLQEKRVSVGETLRTLNPVDGLIADSRAFLDNHKDILEGF